MQNKPGILMRVRVCGIAENGVKILRSAQVCQSYLARCEIEPQKVCAKDNQEGKGKSEQRRRNRDECKGTDHAENIYCEIYEGEREFLEKGVRNLGANRTCPPT